MAYPRRCPVCGIEHGTNGATDRGHVTIKAVSGGTPSPWRPQLPGRILTLRCMACADEYEWDYFANAGPNAAQGSRQREGALE